MKTATIPTIRVESTFLQEVQCALAINESLASFVETAVRHEIQHRQVQAGALQRGSAFAQHNSPSGECIPAEALIARLEAKLAAAKQRR